MNIRAFSKKNSINPSAKREKSSWQLAVGSWQAGNEEEKKKKTKITNYKSQITNKSQITMTEIPNKRLRAPYGLCYVVRSDMTPMGQDDQKHRNTVLP